MPAYHFTEDAIEDLNGIWLYTFDTWLLEQADRYYQLLIDECEFIARHPDKGKSMEYIKKGYRAAKVKSHIIFYKTTKDDMVEIVRILHHQMDVESRLR
ncbi:MAG: type II toxin-antitoxin system RelE/ParE family toxin [Arachidicoccus sp.]|nr:type II toxin-antitoxin system RelE/ParE family toxin [Arachidicoccus sp.]